MLEDKQICPNCRREIHRKPYMMSQRSEESVLTLRQIAWIICAVLALSVMLTLASS